MYNLNRIQCLTLFFMAKEKKKLAVTELCFAVV